MALKKSQLYCIMAQVIGIECAGVLPEPTVYDPAGRYVSQPEG